MVRWWLVETAKDARYVDAISIEHARTIASRRFGWDPSEVVRVTEVTGSAVRVRVNGEIDPAAMTLEEAAHELRVDVQAVEALIAEGRLIGFELRDGWRIRRQDLDALLEGRTPAPGARSRTAPLRGDATDGGEQRDLLRVQDIMRELGVSRSHVYAMMDRGELAYHQVGRARRVSREALQAYLARSRRGPA